MKNNFVINKDVEIPHRSFERKCSEITQVFKDFLSSEEHSMSINFETEEEMLLNYRRIRRYHVYHKMKVANFRTKGNTLYIYKRKKETE